MALSTHALPAKKHLTAFGVRLDLVGFDSPLVQSVALPLLDYKITLLLKAFRGVRAIS